MPATNMRPSGARTGVWATGSLWVAGPTPDPLGQNPWDGAGHLHWGHVSPWQPTGRTSTAQRGGSSAQSPTAHWARGVALGPGPTSGCCAALRLAPPPRLPQPSDTADPSVQPTSASPPSQVRDSGCDWQMDRSLPGTLRHPTPLQAWHRAEARPPRPTYTGPSVVFFHPVIQQKPGPSIVPAPCKALGSPDTTTPGQQVMPGGDHPRKGRPKSSGGSRVTRSM